MSATNLFEIFVHPLAALGLPYAVTGSVASMSYGEPRLTMDVDILVRIEPGRVDDLIAAFPAEHFYVPPEEVIRIEIARAVRGHMNLIHHATGFKADLYPVGSDPLHLWALDCAREFSFGGGTVRLAPPEYVIIRKLEFYAEGGSEKHLRDIRRMLEHSRDQIDIAALESRLTSPGLISIWSKLKNSIPD